MLDAFFKPGAVAVLGASPNVEKAGFAVFKNLKDAFPGPVYPVNVKGQEILGTRSLVRVEDLPSGIDMAVCCIPPQAIPEAVPPLAAKGVRALVVISAGGREVGAEGVRIEREIVARARAHGIRVQGPNCLGIISTASKLNASFAAAMPPAGSIGFFSQSGALCTAILDWAIEERIGFSHFVSLGNKADLTEVEFLDAMADDPNTRVILGYLEEIPDGPRFMAAASRIARTKPIILIKAGTSASGAKAASSHTGSLAGSEKAVAAALRQCGVIRAEGVEELFDLATAFACQPLPAGPRLAVITNAGGPGILTADACDARGVKLPPPGAACLAELKKALPPIAGFGNPIDIIGDARADRYRAAMEAVSKDPVYDGVLCLLTPQAMTEVDATAQAFADCATRSPKPHLAAFMGGVSLKRARGILKEADNGAGVPFYAYPERAVRAFQAMASHAAWRGLPADDPPRFEVDRERARRTFDAVRAGGRLELGEREAREVVEAYGFRIPKGTLAATAEEAARAAREIGYPVAMKISSPEILHKSDIGGVRLRLKSADEVRLAFEEMTARARGAFLWGVLVQEMVRPGKEVIIGVSRDPSFGPVVMFGLGGIYVEVLKDVTFRVAPFGPRSAREMTEEIRAAALLKGARGEKPSDLGAVVDAILRVNQLVTDFPEIVEMDVNPLVVWEKGCCAIDARITIGEGAGAGAARAH